MRLWNQRLENKKSEGESKTECEIENKGMI